jgi:hypothetical protein
MYPIPAVNHLTLDFGNTAFSGSVSMTNIKGQLMLQKTISNETSTMLQWTNLAAGNYFIMLESIDQKLYTREITLL